MTELPPSPYHLPWAWIVINSSGGKDSQTALRQTVLAADEAGIPRHRLVVAHQDLGIAEWKGTSDLVRRQAECYGLRLEVRRYRNKEGAEETLLDYVKRRGKWPDNKNRWCTSEFKRGPGGRLLTELRKQRNGPVLQVFGFRADESPARAKRTALCLNNRFSNTLSPLVDWLPIHQWNQDQVWADIRVSGVPHHFAYDLGMPRLSCVFCIFASQPALMLAGHHNRELLDAYCEVEEVTGHDFQHGKSLRSIRDRLNAGEEPPKIIPTWRM